MDNFQRDYDKYKKIIAWLSYRHLLASNRIGPKLEKVNIDNVLLAARYEPRILEVLPAAIIFFKEDIIEHEFPFKVQKIMDDLEKGLDFEVDGLTSVNMKKHIQRRQELSNNR